MNCCGDMFTEFHFQDLRFADPQNQKGVYVIRVKGRGEEPKRIIEEVKCLIERLNWELVGSFVTDRIDRLRNIDKCPVIYIGANRNSGENTLKDRYAELANRHTIMYPLWTLIYYSWDLEFGWQTTNNPELLEKQLKRKYKGFHKGKLPALVKK